MCIKDKRTGIFHFPPLEAGRTTKRQSALSLTCEFVGVIKFSLCVANCLEQVSGLPTVRSSAHPASQDRSFSHHKLEWTNERSSIVLVQCHLVAYERVITWNYCESLSE